MSSTIHHQEKTCEKFIPCHHTNNCHFIPYRYVIIPTHVISYYKGINSYQYMTLCTSVVSYQNMSFHTPWYVIISTIVISYYIGILSYQNILFHTVNVSNHICTCHCILVLFHTKTCHFIPATACFIRERIV